MIAIALITLIPFIVVGLMRLTQYVDYKKNGKRKETYGQFCRRNYTRYV